MSINKIMECQSKDLLQPTIKTNNNQRTSIRWIDNLIHRKRESVLPNTSNNNFNNNLNYNNYNNNKILYGRKELNIEEMIANAKIHRKANRPLKKIKEFDGSTRFCQCCYLPVKDNLSVKTFNFCENTDNFAACGRGTSLYFSYFRFSALIVFFALISMALPSFLLNNNYTGQLNDICNKLYDISKEKINVTYPICLEFINIKEFSEFSMNDREWVLRYNAINLKQYRELYHQLSNSYHNADKVIMNYNVYYFIGLFTLFIANILYIILLFNINKQYDISVTSPSDYTIIITNLYSAFKIFWKKINRINLINSYIRGLNINLNNDKDIVLDVKENNNEEQKGPKQELKEVVELGLERFPKGKEINILEGFNEFIKTTICESPTGEKFNIYRINICYKISEFMKIENKIQDKKSQIYKINHDPKQIEKNEKLELKDKKRKYFYYPFDAVGLTMLKFKSCEKFYELSDIESEKEKLEKQLKELLKETENLTDDNFAGVVFVTFDNIKEQEKFLEPFPKNLIMSIFVSIKNLKYFLCCCFIDKYKRKRFLLKRNISVDKAPEPEDIIFENLQYSSVQRFFRMLLIYFVSFIIIFICFVIILCFNYLQIKLQKGNNENKKAFKYTLSLLITLVISVLNSVFQFFLDFLTKKERQISMTNYYLSYSVKLTIFTFITSGIIPLISSYYFNSRVNFDLLVTNMFTIFLSNSFLTPITWTMNFEYFFKKLKICLVENKCEHYTQKELNNLYELLDMEIATKYSYITKTLLMSFLYMPIFPLSMFFSFLGLIFGYFVEKYNFANMYKRPEMLNSKICEFYSNYFIINFFMLCVGNYIFIKDIKSNAWPIVNLILFASLMTIPYNQILAFDFIGINESELKKNITYETQYFTFYNDYEKINPMTKKEGIKHFLNKLTSNGLISKKDYDSILNNFENINLMETYYKARINFSNNLMQRVFLGMGDCATNNMSKRQSKFILNFKEFAKQNEGKLVNNLFNHLNQDNNSDSTSSGTNLNFMRKNSHDDNKNNLYKGNLNYLSNNLNLNYSNKNKKHFNHSNFSLKSNNSESRLNENSEQKNNIDIFKIENNNKDNIAVVKKKGQNLIKNIINKEQKNILNLYSNPLFFGIKILFNCMGEKEEEKTNNKGKALINNIIEEQNEDKKDDTIIKINENKDEKKENHNEKNKNENNEEMKENNEDKKSEKNIDNDKKENEEKKENDENKNEENNEKKKKKKRKKKKKKKHKKKKKEEEEEKEKLEEEKKEEDKQKEEDKDKDKDKKENKEEPKDNETEDDKENEKEKKEEKKDDKEKDNEKEKEIEDEKEKEEKENIKKEKVEEKKGQGEEAEDSDEIQEKRKSSKDSDDISI